MMSRPKGLNPETMCPADGPVGHYVLLVDKTDPLNFTQKQAFSVILQELVEKRIPEGYLLSVFVLSEDFKETAAPLVELCNPGDGSGKSELTANQKRLKAQYRLKFIEPVLKQSESLVSTQPAKWSPIFEMLQLVGINAYHKYDVKGERRLIIMSDMLHNTPQFTMYKGPVDYAAFAASDYGKKAQLELSDVEVELHYLMNSPQLQTKRNLKFWEDYFAKAGARIVAVRPLEG
ncbi:hypothetical protein RR42_s3429 [Cupriavidus basilensis]|uniref:Uncharacterized protein n=2 Tax=Cupriavidus basilensis TaxID=68895 RepID=A0A0C4YRA4_9BURK|nr:hypothetical protein RR42_s3429 [Cupriavidus basilensis]